MTPVFFLSPTNRVRVFIRRYSKGQPGCVDGYDYHSAEVMIAEDAPASKWGVKKGETGRGGFHKPPRKSDPRWPTHCERCGVEMADDDERMVNVVRLYKSSADGSLHTIQHAPTGAMWDAEWFEGDPAWTGPDGISLMVRLPDGTDWCVDSQANNCTRPGDRSHKCWIRHGNPRDPQGAVKLHVDKNGETCQAGAGSIATARYHGFLHNGMLT